jgi:squalene-hopene/tetraprenyl-beta-curcumene cyclase
MRRERLREVLEFAERRLLADRADRAHWTGELAPSALSTATAVAALALHDRDARGERLGRGLNWLAATQNTDGGWGDTPESRSNISTSWLVYAAFRIAASSDAPCLARCKSYLEEHGGPDAVIARYGRDRTFSAPILSMLATAGLCEWRDCPALPFWMAALPRSWFPRIGLRVVSYALPALIGVGLAIFEKTRGRSRLDPLKRCVVPRVLRQLESITPQSGGYLEAIPLTAFVAMNLINAGHGAFPTVRRNVDFLLAQQRPDGSWPIDQDLAVWVTTLGVQALGGGDEAVRDWILRQQTRVTHPFTGAAPGAWGWTWASGSVPDVDDTSGALLALALLPEPARSLSAACDGTRWLLDVQNRDGGWPTFCRGWNKLPFDQSCPDLTAHALRAMHVWAERLPREFATRVSRARARGLRYLESCQQPDGSWLPLWFGNESAPGEKNPVLGTSRVLCAWADLALADQPAAQRGKAYLLDAQNPDGSWGGAKGVEGSIEETALACEALTRMPTDAAAEPVLDRGFDWLCRHIEEGGLDAPAPIGLYFANLWYFEKLYPILFSVAALRQALKRDSADRFSTSEKHSLA